MHAVLRWEQRVEVRLDARGRARRRAAERRLRLQLDEARCVRLPVEGGAPFGDGQAAVGDVRVCDAMLHRRERAALQRAHDRRAPAGRHVVRLQHAVVHLMPVEKEVA